MTTVEEAKNINEGKGKEFEQEISKIKDTLNKDSTRMELLKKSLYAKFGNAINLDEN